MRFYLDITFVLLCNFVTLRNRCTTSFFKIYDNVDFFLKLWLNILPPISFIRHTLTGHGLVSYTLTIYLFYIILFMIINIWSLERTFDYKSNNVKFVL